MNMNDIQYYRDHLNNIPFRGISDVKIGDAVIIDLHLAKLPKLPFRSLAGLFLKLISTHQDYTLDKSRNSEKSPLFFLAQCHLSRKDYLLAFENVSNLFSQRIILRGLSRGRRIKLNNFLMIRFLMCWTWQLRSLNGGISLKISFLRQLLEAYEWVRYVQPIINDPNVSSLIVLFDARFHENILVQLCRAKGIPTATLQHGHFLAKSDDGTKGIAFDGFVSDQMFVWGEYTKLEAIEAGIPEEAIKVVGCPKYIGLKRPEPKIVTDIRTVGVVLEGGTSNTYLRDANYQMVQTVVQYAEATGCSLLIKPHPVSNNDYLEPLLANKANIRFTEKTLPVADFASSVDIAVAMGSTVYAELLYLGVIVFRFLTASAPDRYSRITLGSYKDFDSLTKTIDEFTLHQKEMTKKFNDVSSLLINDVDASQSYIQSINKLGEITAHT